MTEKSWMDEPWMEDLSYSTDLQPGEIPAVIFQLKSFKLDEYGAKEMLGLAESAGYRVIHYFVQSGHLSSKYFLQTGRMRQIQKILKPEVEMEDYISLDPLEYTEEEYEQILNEHFLSLESEIDIENEPWKDPRSQKQGMLDLARSLREFDSVVKDLSVHDRSRLTILFNNRLTNMQMINLFKAWEVKVIDRDQLILEIFDRNARTKEAKLQVELAKMAFEATRLKKDVGMLLDEKQGRDFAGKGMPAWAPLERSLKERKRLVQEELEKIQQNRQVQRKGRLKYFNVAIAGYTNAGKSTFLNSIANTHQETNASEFTTSRPKSNDVKYPIYDEDGQFLSFEKIIFTDTVGFIYDIPHQFIDAFLSTLEEIKYTNAILLFADVTDEKDAIHTKIKTSVKVLKDIGVETIPILYVLNKIDEISEDILNEKLKFLKEKYPDSDFLQLSGKDRVGFNELMFELYQIKKQGYYKE